MGCSFTYMICGRKLPTLIGVCIDLKISSWFWWKLTIIHNHQQSLSENCWQLSVRFWKKKTIFLLIFLAAHIALERACLQKITFFQTSVTIDVLFLKNKGVVKVGEMLALTAITDKMFKTNFVFQIKRRTTGSFQYLHFCNFVLVLPKVLFREDV